MVKTVEGYLAELKRHLRGVDPALAQDALYDAEEYLRSALAEQGGDPEIALDGIVEAYGTPAEIAAAYKDTEITVQRALRPPAVRTDRPWYSRFFGVVADPAAWGSLFYMVLALATGVTYFTVVVTGMSLTLGLAILIIGIPFALLFLAVVRAVSLVEGRVVEGLLGERMPRRPRTLGGVQSGQDMWSRIKSWLGDYRTWTTMLYMLLQLPLGITYFTMVVTALATSVGIIAAPIVQLVYDTPVFRFGDYGYLIEPWAIPLVMALGVLGVILTLWLAKGIGILHGAYAKVMLVGRVDQGSPATATGNAAVSDVSALAAPVPASATEAPAAPAPGVEAPAVGGDER